MKLGSKRRIFTRHLADLLLYANGLGLGTALDAVLRKTGGHRKSTHRVGLGADVNLYKPRPLGSGWSYLTSTKAHEPLGLYWENKSGWYMPNGARVAKRTAGASFLEFCWGGRFNDGNHYSIKHAGVE